MLMPLGTKMPVFSLPDTITGKIISTSDLIGKPTVVMFLANKCPYVRHLHIGMADFGRFVRARNGCNLVAINSSDVSLMPEEAPEIMGAMAKELEWIFPYCYDETQEVAEMFRATCTPDVFIFNAEGLLCYRGQFDSSRPNRMGPITGWDARGALMDLLYERLPPQDPKPSFGTAIRWKPGRGNFDALPPFPPPEVLRDIAKEKEEAKRAEMRKGMVLGEHEVKAKKRVESGQGER